MILLELAESAAGILLIGVVLLDVFRSVVLPRATPRTLRLGPFIGTTLLRWTLRWARRRPREKRHNLLGALGPFLIVLEGAIWITLLIWGFGFILHALRAGFDPAPDLMAAVYASSSSFLTLGLNGPNAHGLWARAVVTATGLCGFAVVPLVVTFLMNIQGALTRREELVLRVGERDRKPPTGPGILEQHARLGRESEEALVRFFDDWDRWSANVLLTHRAFPILAYFRSTDEECEWLAALGAVLDAAALISALEHDTAAEHAALCHRMGTRLVRDLARTFGCTPDPDADLDRSRFDRARARLRRVGYGGDAAEDGDGAAFKAFQDLRAQHEPGLAALCRRFGVQRAAW